MARAVAALVTRGMSLVEVVFFIINSPTGGRYCVLCSTHHRAWCITVFPSDRGLLQGAPSRSICATPFFLGSGERSSASHVQAADAHRACIFNNTRVWA